MMNESSYDSDDFPKGPYASDQNEADTPQHCANCHVFLENPLTSEGYDYVLAKMADTDERNAAFLPGQILSTVVREWAEFYELMDFWGTPMWERFDICEASYCYD